MTRCRWWSRAGPLLVLMDIDMPGMGGAQAARLIWRARPEAVLLMSTYDAAELPSDATSCGTAGYVHKERLDADALRQAWHNHLTSRR